MGASVPAFTGENQTDRMTAKSLPARKRHATFSFMKATTHFRSAIFLRPGKLDELLAVELTEAGVKPTKPRMAALLNLDYVTYWRATKPGSEHRKPAQEFIAAVLAHFGDDSFSEIFEVREPAKAAA